MGRGGCRQLQGWCQARCTLHTLSADTADMGRNAETDAESRAGALSCCTWPRLTQPKAQPGTSCRQLRVKLNKVLFYSQVAAVRPHPVEGPALGGAGSRCPAKAAGQAAETQGPSVCPRLHPATPAPLSQSRVGSPHPSLQSRMAPCPLASPAWVPPRAGPRAPEGATPDTLVLWAGLPCTPGMVLHEREAQHQGARPCVFV